MKRRFILFMFIVCMSSVNITPAQAANVNYYKQLNTEQKKIYKEMYKHFYENDEMKYSQKVNGTYDGIAMETVGSKYQRNALLAYSAMINDHPEFYWGNQISLSYTGGNLLSGSSLVSSYINSYTFMLTADSTWKKQNAYEKKLNKAIKKINKKLKKTKSKYKKLLVIHNYLCSQTKYAHKKGMDTSGKYRYLHTSYGVFVKKKAVCDGYSMAFKELCDYYKIPCMIVYGQAKNKYGVYENHAWNIVKLNKKWYAVDCTFDDSSKSSKWFLCGKKVLKKTHISIPKHADVLQDGYFSYPKLNKKSYKK